MVKSKYKLLKITNNIQDYPECKTDTLNYPSLVDEVEDEMQCFMVDIQSGTIYRMDDILEMIDFDELTLTRYLTKVK